MSKTGSVLETVLGMLSRLINTLDLLYDKLV